MLTMNKVPNNTASVTAAIKPIFIKFSLSLVPRPVLAELAGGPNQLRNLLRCQFLEPAHVGDALFVAGDDHFCSLADRLAIFAADRRSAASSLLREGHLAGAAALPNGAGNAPKDTDHVVICRV